METRQAAPRTGGRTHRKGADLSVRQDRPGYFSLAGATSQGRELARQFPYSYSAGRTAYIVALAQGQGMTVKGAAKIQRAFDRLRCAS